MIGDGMPPLRGTWLWCQGDLASGLSLAGLELHDLGLVI